MKQLHMVGTSHEDFKGPERLEKFLRSVRPDYIGLESTVEGFDKEISCHNEMSSERSTYTIKLSEVFGAKGAENMMIYMIMLGYESWVPSNYANENKGVTIVPCDIYRAEDIHDQAQKVLGANNAFKSKDKLFDLVKGELDDIQEILDSNYLDNSLSDIQEYPELFKRLCQDRDEVAEKKIRETFEATNHSMAYIGGAGHIFGEYHNLFDRLKDLNPTRMRLLDVDKWEMGR